MNIPKALNSNDVNRLKKTIQNPLKYLFEKKNSTNGQRWGGSG